MAGFDYTLDALADHTAGLLEHLGITRYAMYVRDYGAPVGWRLALRTPDATTAIITQNGNGYDADSLLVAGRGSALSAGADARDRCDAHGVPEP